MNIARKILIVDDDPILGKIISRLLQKENYHYEIYITAEDAILHLQQESFELILLDIVLPGMSGIEALIEIKKSFQIPVIMMTAERDPAMLEKAFHAGADDYLVKPLEYTELMWRIRTHLERLDDKMKLKLSERKYKNLFNVIQEGIIIIGNDLKILNINPVAKQILQLTDVDMLPGNELHKKIEILDESGQLLDDINNPVVISLQQNRPCSDVSLKLKYNKNLYWLSVNTVPLNDYDNKVTGVVISFRDISEKKQTEQILRQTAKMESLGQLTGGIAHDFNNLLGIISGNLELIELANDGNEKIKKRVGTAGKAAKRAAELTRKLLDYSRKKPSCEENLNLKDILLEMEDILRPTIGKTVELSYAVEDDLWLIYNDRSEIENIILNLVINAKDAMADGGLILISAKNLQMDEFKGYTGRSEAGRYVMLSIKDSGSGIPPDLIEKIFEPFFTTKSIEKGTGLGLSIVYNFMKNSYGNIQLASESGNGTEFKLFFKASGNEKEKKDDYQTKGCDLLAGEGKIIILDDEEDLAEIAGEMITAEGYQAEIFNKAEDVINYLEKRGHADLLFTDIVMPGDLDGYKLAKIIEEKWNNLPILFTTGYPQKSGIGVSFRELNHPVVYKPYNRNDLRNAINSILNKR